MPDIAPINPLAPAPSITPWQPDWRIVYGIVTGIVSDLALAVVQQFLPPFLLVPAIINGIPLLAGFTVAYLTHMTQQEVANRLSNPIIKLANADIDNQKVTAKIVSGIESDKETAKDVERGVIPDAIIEKLPT